MGTAALVLGIISLVMAVVGSFAGLVGIIIGSFALLIDIAFTAFASVTAIVAITLGAIAKKDPNQKGAKAGLVMGIIAISYGIIATVACIGAAAQPAYYW